MRQVRRGLLQKLREIDFNSWPLYEVCMVVAVSTLAQATGSTETQNFRT
jgi:hypothetical protein